MVNKKISNSKRINDLPLQAQLLFTWLIPHLDCNGCFYGSAQMIKSLVVPRKNWPRKQIEKWLLMMENSKNLEGTPLICRYIVNMEQYLFMPGFVGEQIGLRYDKEKPEFPIFDGNNTEKVGGKGKGRGREVEEEDKEESSSLEEIINLYKKMVGLREEESLSESLEDEIKKAIDIFSDAWVHDAIEEAIRKNKRHWGYVVGILDNWKRFGKNAKTSRKFYGKGGRGFVPKGTYSEILAEHQRRASEKFGKGDKEAQ